MRTSWWFDNHIVMRIVLLIVIAGSALMPGCSTASPPPAKAATSLAALEARRVHLPSIDPTLQSCPVTGGRAADRVAPLAGDSNLAVGSGPVFPTIAGPSPASAALPFPPSRMAGKLPRCLGFHEPAIRDPLSSAAPGSTVPALCGSTRNRPRLQRSS